MDISKLSDEQKSVMLARAQGWRIIDGINIVWIEDPEIEGIQLFSVRKNALRDGRSEDYKTLFHPKNFPLAWRILQNFKNEGGNLKDTDIYEWLYMDDLAEAQRFFLDKIFFINVEHEIIIPEELQWT